jgi:hypothetical protein
MDAQSRKRGRYGGFKSIFSKLTRRINIKAELRKKKEFERNIKKLPTT